ncbi:hypothetical protein NDU88_001448 [Pleurodeles waltl]|uniref:Uncharacterized protein n=1 Tax=Pleurodeles waltl TaxID=8319 RepID=A0AAV7MKH7_PLEWA|nr:hypothetical protein NDU88_001448 [Pleurodeles waltl]
MPAYGPAIWPRGAIGMETRGPSGDPRCPMAEASTPWAAVNLSLHLTASAGLCGPASLRLQKGHPGVQTHGPRTWGGRQKTGPHLTLGWILEPPPMPPYAHHRPPSTSPPSTPSARPGRPTAEGLSSRGPGRFPLMRSCTALGEGLPQSTRLSSPSSLPPLQSRGCPLLSFSISRPHLTSRSPPLLQPSPALFFSRAAPRASRARCLLGPNTDQAAPAITRPGWLRTPFPAYVLRQPGPDSAAGSLLLRLGAWEGDSDAPASHRNLVRATKALPPPKRCLLF